MKNNNNQISPENKRKSKNTTQKDHQTNTTNNKVATRKSTENDAPNNAVVKVTNIATNGTNIIRTENDVI